MCEWLGRYELGDVKIFIFNKLEVLYSKRYGSIWVTFRVNERVKHLIDLRRNDHILYEYFQNIDLISIHSYSTTSEM